MLCLMTACSAALILHADATTLVPKFHFCHTCVSSLRAKRTEHTKCRTSQLCMFDEIFDTPPIQNTALADAKPLPQLSPREVVATMLSALHKSNIDTPRLRF